jgi:maltose O-acetyltransferase
MTEKEKMLAGEFYNTRDEELIGMYFRTKRALRTFNNSDPEDHEHRLRLLSELLCKEVHDSVWIESPFFCDYGENITIGKNTFINSNTVFIDNNSITIGENVLIAPNVQIYTATHPTVAKERVNINNNNEAPYKTFTKPVTIGNNVWIGGGAIILPGVTIGDNTTIGAGSVVNIDIPSGVLAAGNPCKVIKKL